MFSQRHHDDSISNIQFAIEETVSALHGPLETVIPSYQTILRIIQKDLISAIYSGNSKEVATQTTTSSNQETNENRIRRDLDPLRVGSDPYPLSR